MQTSNLSAATRRGFLQRAAAISGGGLALGLPLLLPRASHADDVAQSLAVGASATAHQVLMDAASGVLSGDSFAAHQRSVAAALDFIRANGYGPGFAASIVQAAREHPELLTQVPNYLG